MEGGELLLRHPTRPLWRREPPSSRVVDGTVSPKENAAVVFRGDAEPAVRAVREAKMGGGNVNAGGKEDEKKNGTERFRISVVLEQYRVPIADVSWLVDFEVVDSSNYVRTD